MRKIIFILAVFLSAAIISCSGDSDSDVSVGYIDPGLSSAKEQAIKSYTLGTESCASSKACGAIIYIGTLDANYVGFAVDNYLTGASKFSLKIYWPATSIPSSISNPSGYVVEAIIGTTTYTTATGNLAANITQGTDSNGITIYTISFTDTLNIGSGALTIISGNTIVAYKYP